VWSSFGFGRGKDVHDNIGTMLKQEIQFPKLKIKNSQNWDSHDFGGP
jgi:hypothetical protein